MTAPQDTLVIAHRGAWGELPENTLEAFEEAVRLGADMVELDVRRTADGRLVAHHDPVDAVRSDELTAPLLHDVVEQLAARIPLNLELKERGCEAEVAGILSRFHGENCMITSFLDDVVREAKGVAPQFRTGLVIGGAQGDDAVLRARRCGADYLVLEAGLVDDTTTELPYFVWTVNEQEAIDRFLYDTATAGVITDRPDLALERRSLLSGRTGRATPR